MLVLYSSDDAVCDDETALIKKTLQQNKMNIQQFKELYCINIRHSGECT